jgi:type II secretory ATPase GspE/PulE/Tfp pilus assembly ATPase PilB-like protein
MRQDPDIILVGEIRDAETAATSVQAALTGHLLISTLHTNDAAGAVQRLEDLGIDRFKIAGSLLASLAQRLLRKVCPHCRAEIEPNAEVLQRLLEGRTHIHLPPSATFYAGPGCPKCLSTGYSGRVPVYEIMEVTPQLEKAIEGGASHSKLREVAMSEGMVDLAAGGMERALAGQTTVEEVYFKLSM